MELYNALVQILVATSKTKLHIQCKISREVYELLQELPNNFRLRILGNQEIFEKSQISVETQPSVQSPFQKLNFGNSSQKTRSSRYQTLLYLSIFTTFFNDSKGIRTHNHLVRKRILNHLAELGKKFLDIQANYRVETLQFY